MLSLLVACVYAQDTANPQERGNEKPQVLLQKLAVQIGWMDRSLDVVLGLAILDLSVGRVCGNEAKLTSLYTVQSSELVPDSAIMSTQFTNR
jgi:hypothetical protein